MQHIREQLEEIIHRVQPQTKEKGIEDGSQLVSDLGLDSYDRFEIMLIAETTFGMTFSEDEEDIVGKTFAELVELVTQKIRKRNAT